MEDITNERSENRERRDYASTGEAGGFSSQGRKLRPRRKVTAERVKERSSSYEPHGNYKDRHSYGDRRPGYGDRRSSSYGERRSNYGERPSSYGDRRSAGSYGERHSSYGERQSNYNNRREDNGSPAYHSSRPSYNRDDHFGQHRSFDNSRREHSSYRSNGSDQGYSSNGPRRSFHEGGHSYGDRSRSYGDNGHARRPFNEEGNGERRQYVRKPAGARSFGSRPGSRFEKPADRSHGGRKPFRSNAYFTATDEAGINQMLATKPQVSDNAEYSDNDLVKTPIKEEIRLNKYIANSGICSRREADNFIMAGVVTVNGEVVTELGTKVNVITDVVKFNGEMLKGEAKVYIVMNKPKGFVTSASDPHADKTVMDLLKGCKTRVFPVGRLDKNTTGVLMFTNDGELAEQLTHPQYNKKKIYQVILDNPLEEADKDKIMNEGLDLSDGNIKADELEYIDADDHRRLGIEIHSGKNRIVRRIFESLGYDVRALDRVYFAGLTKKGLKKGEWRYLSEGEVNILKMGAYV